MLRISCHSKALWILAIVGTCGEMPISALNFMNGNNEYSRRVVTKLIREGYLREWVLKDDKRHVIRSLSLTARGMEQVENMLPLMGRAFRERVFSQGPAHGDRERALRLHRGAYCFVMAALLRAYWAPLEDKMEYLGNRPVYFSAYELNQRMGWDSKGSRVSGLYLDEAGNGTLFYYLGYSNLRWNPEVEEGVRHRILQSFQGPLGVYYPRTLITSLLIGRDWSLAESLVKSNNRQYTRFFKGRRLYEYYYTTADEDGLRLARMQIDDEIQEEVSAELENRGLVRNKDDNDYLFRIFRLCDFQPRNAKERFFAPTEGVFLEQQREAAERINRAGAEIRIIPKKCWDETWDELHRRYQQG